ncbi:MAG: hypothetical protein IJV27_09990 [Prevotella sp.]|nr:hypothetical protein [Prevotella sp.]
MESVQTIDVRVVSLLENEDFLRYVLESDGKQHRRWSRFEHEHPLWKPAIDKAIYILQHLDTIGKLLSEEEMDGLKARIKKTLSI